jgi:hypothetical protein
LFEVPKDLSRDKLLSAAPFDQKNRVDVRFAGVVVVFGSDKGDVPGSAVSAQPSLKPPDELTRQIPEVQVLFRVLTERIGVECQTPKNTCSSARR